MEQTYSGPSKPLSSVGILIKNGLRRGSVARCSKGNGNLDICWILIHTDINHKIIEFQTILFYFDENFPARNEPLNANRYLDVGYESRYLEKVVNHIWRAQNPTASTLFAMLDEAGFNNKNHDGRFCSNYLLKDKVIPIPAGAALEVYEQALGTDDTSFALDSLFFRLAMWITDRNERLYITYDSKTDAIISISADEPSMSEQSE